MNGCHVYECTGRSGRTAATDCEYAPIPATNGFQTPGCLMASTEICYIMQGDFTALPNNAIDGDLLARMLSAESAVEAQNRSHSDFAASEEGAKAAQLVHKLSLQISGTSWREAARPSLGIEECGTFPVD